MNRHTTSVTPSGRLLTSAAMFAAMITLTTAYLFHIPIGANGGYIHFGDAFSYLAASLLPMPYACAAAAIGGGLADFLSGVPFWVIPTMIIKPLTAVWFTSHSERLLCRRNVCALILAGLVSNAGYYIAEALFSGNWLAPLALQWGGVVQSAGSAVLFLLAAAAADRLGLKKQLFRTQA